MESEFNVLVKCGQVLVKYNEFIEPLLFVVYEDNDTDAVRLGAVPEDTEGRILFMENKGVELAEREGESAIGFVFMSHGIFWQRGNDGKPAMSNDPKTVRTLITLGRTIEGYDRMWVQDFKRGEDEVIRLVGNETYVNINSEGWKETKHSVLYPLWRAYYLTLLKD